MENKPAYGASLLSGGLAAANSERRTEQEMPNEIGSVKEDASGGSGLSAGLAADDICGFCGQPGADKIPHPVRWPDEESAGTELVHAECEQAECARASALITGKRRDDFLRNCC